MTRPPTIAFAGASGWLGRFIGPGLLRAGVTDGAHFHALNRSGPSDDYAGWGISWHRALADVPPPDVLVLSVRPADFRAARFHCPDALVVSVMAGVLMAELEAHTGSARIIRALPNALVETASSYTPWLASHAVTEEDKALARDVFTGSGTEAEVPDEAALDVLTTLSGAGPAYAALLARALTRAGVEAGLAPELAAGAAENLVCAASAQLAGRIGQAPAVVQSFIDYDGVIAAGLRRMEAEGFDSAVAGGIRAALEKVQEMNRA